MAEAGLLPSVNAGLNSLSAALLAAGWLAVKGGRIGLHRSLMGAAFLCSTLFLASYLYYHYHAGSVRYQGQGPSRAVYFAILVSHTVLATAVAPMALRTVYLAARGRFDDHRRWARRTLPLWLYVSVTGVVVYWMLYR